MILFYLFLNIAEGFKECSSGSDTAKPTVEFLVTPFFPHKTPRAIKCKYSLSVNYGEYIKLVPDVIDLPCRGKNGIYIEEEGGRSGPFCGPKRMPAFVSRDVRMDIHIVIDTPLGGARVKLGYKAVTSPKGPNVARARGVKVANMPLAVLKMAPDQGQGQLQQQNLQNRENDRLNQEQERGQGQGSQDMQAPAPVGGRHKPKVAPREWVSETYNPVSNYEPPLINGSSRKSPSSGSSGVEFVLPILFLIILISILIAVMHKRRQKMKDDLKKLEEKGGSTAHNTIKKDFIPINNGTNSMEKAEPSLEQINHVINANQSAASFESPPSSEPSSSSEAPKSMPSTKKVVQAPTNKYVPSTSKEPTVSNASASKRDTIEPPPVPSNTLVDTKKVVAAPSNKLVTAPTNKVVTAPTNKIQKKSISQESHDSQATTAPSIPQSEYPKPDRPTRAPVARPSRKVNQSPDDDDRPSY